MSYLIAVDVGIVNVGLCIYDVRCKKIVLWDCVKLAHYVKPSTLVQSVFEFVGRYQHYFDDAKQVLVEKQMRCNMRIIESVLHGLFFNRCKVIMPRCVKMHYKLSGKDYRENKAKAVLWTRAYVPLQTALFADNVGDVFEKSNKKDDLADALLLLLYYMHTYF